MQVPVQVPLQVPVKEPAREPAREPTREPVKVPIPVRHPHPPSEAPSKTPSEAPSRAPSETPSKTPSEAPSKASSATSEAPAIVPQVRPAEELGGELDDDDASSVHLVIAEDSSAEEAPTPHTTAHTTPLATPLKKRKRERVKEMEREGKRKKADLFTSIDGEMCAICKDTSGLTATHAKCVHNDCQIGPLCDRCIRPIRQRVAVDDEGKCGIYQMVPGFCLRCFRKKCEDRARPRTERVKLDSYQRAVDEFSNFKREFPQWPVVDYSASS
jgi:hypothetical protein